MIRNILKNIQQLYLKNKFNKRSTILGKINFSSTSKILLQDGSDKKDIVMENDIIMFGNLFSANGGKIQIGEKSSIRRSCKIFCANKITIGKNVIFSDNIIVSDTNHHPINPNDRLKMNTSGWSSKYWSWRYSDSVPIYIEDNVWVGQYARINKGVTIGENSIVAANTVVTKDVPKNSIVAGNPGKIVKIDIDKLPRKLC